MRRVKGRMMDMAARDTSAEGRSETQGTRETQGGRETHYDRAEYIGRLYDDNFSSLRRLAFALVGEAAIAEEIAQEAFVRLYASWRRLDRLEHAPSFLRRIVVNLCRSRGRRIAVGQRLDPLVRGPSSVEPPDVALRLDIWTALGSLPHGQRTCMVLRYLEDLPEAEIAELLGCSIGTVKSQLYRARQKLGPLLREEAGGKR
jgi:RNA polymerase sigma-70 factor (sigma-E family)